MTDVRPPEVFEELYQREYRSVVAFAYSLCGSWGGAEELAQEAFLAAYREWDRIGAYLSPEAWLRRVVANRAASGWRRRGSEARALTKLAGRREEPLAAGIDHEFWTAVRALPDRQAQVVALHYLEDRSVDEIAAILELASGTVKVHLHRARLALAEALRLEVEDEF
ncbi:MAG: RNA polymerase sigma factor [Acidimicrobiales bacterium]